MTTTFALLCARCGLSQREVAEFLDMRQDSVASYSAGRRTAPAGAVDELRSLYERIELAADEGIERIESIYEQVGERPGVIELGIASDDHEAQSLGWPCVGAHAAVLGLVAARADIPIVIVPRGSTPATAAAADMHEKSLKKIPRSSD